MDKIVLKLQFKQIFTLVVTLKLIPIKVTENGNWLSAKITTFAMKFHPLQFS